MSISDYIPLLDVQKVELSKVKLEKPKQLTGQAYRDWREISDGTHRFDREKQEVAVLLGQGKGAQGITQQQLLAFMEVRF